MSTLQEKSSGLFERFAKQLGKVDLSMATAMPAMVGVLTVLSGAALEAHGQLGVLQHSGIAALDAYKASIALDLNFSDWLQRGMDGKLPSFGGNIEARGFVTMAVAPMLGVATVSLARQFDNLKSTLSNKLQSIREWMRSPEPEDVKPSQDGRFAWAREREQTPADGGSWRDQSRPPLEPDSRIGAMEMIKRLALAHRINVNELVIQGDEIRQVNMPSGDRPICKMGSLYWATLELETRELHRFAHKHQLDANALYMRDGVVYEENPEAFVDRAVCTTDSREWNEVRREMSAEINGRVFGVHQAQTAPHVPVPDDEGIVSALITLGEDVTAERVGEVRAQISALRTAQPNSDSMDLVSEVDAARRAAEKSPTGVRESEAAAQSPSMPRATQYSPSFEM